MIAGYLATGVGSLYTLFTMYVRNENIYVLVGRFL